MANKAERTFPVGPFINGVVTRLKRHNIGAQALVSARNIFIEPDGWPLGRKSSKKYGTPVTSSAPLGIFQIEDRGEIRYNFALVNGSLFERDSDGSYFAPSGGSGFVLGQVAVSTKLSNALLIGNGVDQVRLVSLDRPQEIYVADTGNNRILVLGADTLSLLRGVGPTVGAYTLISPSAICVDARYYYVLDSDGSRILKILRSDDSTTLAIALTGEFGVTDIDVDDTHIWTAGTNAGGERPWTRGGISRYNKATGVFFDTTANPNGSDTMLRSIVLDDEAFYTVDPGVGGNVIYKQLRSAYVAGGDTPVAAAFFYPSLNFEPAQMQKLSADSSHLYHVVSIFPGDSDGNKLTVLRKNDLGFVRTVEVDADPYGIFVDDAVIYIAARTNDRVTALLKDDILSGVVVLTTTFSTTSMVNPSDVSASKYFDSQIKDAGAPGAVEVEAIAIASVPIPPADGAPPPPTALAAGTYVYKAASVEIRGRSSAGPASNIVTIGANQIAKVGRIPKLDLGAAVVDPPETDLHLFRSRKNTTTPLYRLDTGIVLERIANLYGPLSPALGTAGAFVPAGEAVYIYTYQTAKGETEGTDEASIIVPTAGNVLLSLIDNYDGRNSVNVTPTDIMKNIYRKASDGLFHRLTAAGSPTIGNNTTKSFTDGVPDATLLGFPVYDPAFYDYETDAAIQIRERAPRTSATAPIATALATYQNRAFAVDRRRPNEIVWSVLTEGGGDPDYWPLLNTQIVGNDGAPITCLFKLGKSLTVATADRVYTFNLVTDDNASLDETEADTGVVGPRAAVTDRGIGFFWGKFGVYAFDGSNTKFIMDGIPAEALLIDFTKADQIVAVKDEANGRALWFVDMQDGTQKYFALDLAKFHGSPAYAGAITQNGVAVWTFGDFPGRRVVSAAVIENDDNIPVVVVGLDNGEIHELFRTTSGDEGLAAAPIEFETGMIPLDNALARGKVAHLLLNVGSYAADSLDTTVTLKTQSATGAIKTETVIYRAGGTADGAIQRTLTFASLRHATHVSIKFSRPDISGAPTQLLAAAFTASRIKVGGANVS